MKNTKILLILPLMLLVGCDTNSTSTVAAPKAFEEKLTDYVGANLKLEGTLSYKFYDSTTGQPTSGDPVTTNLTVSFTSTGYEISYEGDFDEDFTETLFKSEDNTVELRQINAMNELKITRPTKEVDGEQVEFDFEPYTNPFKLLKTENLIVGNNEASASLNLQGDDNLSLASEFVSRLTYYSFDALNEVSFVADSESITSIHIETPMLTETMRSGTYTFDLNVTGVGDEVTGPVTPEPAKPNEKQALLQTALEELMNSDYEAKASIPDYGAEFNLYKNNVGFFARDTSSNKYDMGVCKLDDKIYDVAYDYDTKVDVLYPAKEGTSHVPNWTMFSPVLYDVSEDGKTFTTSKLVSSYIQEFAYYIAHCCDYSVMMASSVSFTLDEEGHLSKVVFNGEYYMMAPIEIQITTIGSCTMPIDFASLTIIE